MDGFVGLKPTNVVLNTQHVEGRGDLAFATGTFEMTVGGQKATGHYGEVFTKQSDGSWKYRVDSYGFDAPAKK
jgi:ketosteroid isomerase-like protein